MGHTHTFEAKLFDTHNSQRKEVKKVGDSRKHLLAAVVVSNNDTGIIMITCI
jgi:hypothetical protein